MHRRVLKSFAPLVGAAALIAAPIAFAAPASAAVIAPDETIPFDPELLDPAAWEEILGEEEDIDAWCESFGEIPTPVDIPEIEDLFELGSDEDPADFGYVLAVLTGTSIWQGEETEPTEEESTQESAPTEEDVRLAPSGHELYWEPSVGDELVHADEDNAELILCIAEFEEETTPTPPVSKPPVTGPVVETDRVADTAPAAGLGLAAAATGLVAGAGALLVGRRRQGSHR